MANELNNSSVAKNISEMYLHSDFADVNFIFPDEKDDIKLPAHKSILAKASPVFAALFFGPVKSGDDIPITVASSSAFKEFLQFFYLSQVTLTMENIDAVVRLAEKYEMRDFVGACGPFLKKNLSKDTMIWGYQLAIALKNDELQTFCEEKIQSYSKEIFQSDAFLRCDKIIVERILQMETMFCDEFDLFKACIEWGKLACRKNGLDENDPKAVREQLGVCFKLIRFETMLTGDLYEILSNPIYEGLFNREELVGIMRSTLEEKNKFTLRSTPTFEWHDYRLVEVSRFKSIQNQEVFIKQHESTWFSTNAPLLLGGRITFTDLESHYDSPYYEDCPGSVTIFEYSDRKMGNNGPARELVKMDTNSFNGNSIHLVNPIIIRPKKLYEIQWKTTSSTSQWFHCCSFEKEVKLGGNLIITFHDNSGDCGLVSFLQFNQI